MSYEPDLPQARLIPKDGNDRMAIARRQVVERARQAGRIAVLLGKVAAIFAVTCVALWGLGTLRQGRTRTSELDKSLENIRRINESLKSMRQMPDYAALAKSLRATSRVDTPSRGSAVLVPDGNDGRSPAQAATSSR
jgi:hypothetical protein